MSHQTIEHNVWYLDGEIQTNSIEESCSLLKRGFIGQYYRVSLNHLPRLLDEFCYRHNIRKAVGLFDAIIARGLGV
jgi:hypothetical protein